ncbi:MAG: class I SAM-dependent methyltransferase [Dehalococcoidia bacterium]
MARLEQQRDAWDEFAASYDDAVTPTATTAAEAALSLAGVREGDRLLDVAAGPGALSVPAARLGAHVLAVDFSPHMVHLLNERARQEGLVHLEARVMDGTALDFDPGTFDVACSQLGIMLFPQRAEGLRELARVTRPGGTGVMSVFGPPDRVPGLAMFFQAAAKSLPGFSAPPPRESPLFCLSDPQDLITEMTDAGFIAVHVEQIETVMHVESGDELWTRMLGAAPAVAGLFRDATEAGRDAIRREVDVSFRSRFGDGPADVPFVFNVGIGSR